MHDPSGGLTDGGRDVLFEESLSMRDQEGASNLITVTRVLGLFLIVSTLGSLVLVVGVGALMFVDMAGGIDVALAVVDALLTERPLPIVGFLLFGVATIVLGLLLIVGFVRQMGRVFDRQIHVQVTDGGVTVQRTGSPYWRSPEIEIPFDAITSVEYVDPDESSLRLELSDWRAKRFFAGRSRSWIRLERGDDSAVYIGSDRPIELAETIAQRAPGVEHAEPF